MKRSSVMKLLAVITTALFLSSCTENNAQTKNTTMNDPANLTDSKYLDTATVGGGCFWCTEAQYQLLDGIVSVTSGFAGGTVKNPSYKEVCNGNTGHAEVTQVVYDTRKLNYADILQAFFASHDPTQLN